MQWTNIDAQGDPGQTFAADVPGGVLVRTIGPGTTTAVVFLQGVSANALTAPPPAPPPTRVDRDTLDPEDRALWDRIAAADPRVTELTPEQFELVSIGVRAAQE
jgi:hypothetical protein